MKSKHALRHHTPIEVAELTPLETEFIVATGFLFDWDECEGLLGPTEPNGKSTWFSKEELIKAYGEDALSKAVDLINNDGFTALPF